MNKQTRSPKSHRLPLWRRCVGYFTTLLMFLQVLVPSVASASALLADDAIENALNNDPQFIKNTSGRFSATPFLTVSNGYYSIDNFYQCLFTNSKSSLVGPRMVPIGVGEVDLVIPTYERPSTMGSAFVQARYVRQQILGLLRRHLINSDAAAYASEARQLRTLYENACQYAQDNPGKKYGTRLELSREDAPKDMIWPELRTINGKPLVVPVVYLTADTIAKRRVVDQTTEFNGSAVFRAVDIEGSTLRFGRNGFLRVTDNIVNNGGRIVGADDLTLVAGGAFVNLSGVVQAEGDLTVVAQHIENRTLVHRYELGQAHERFGEIAETRSNTGDITFRSYGDIVFQSAAASAQGNITFQADGNIEIGGEPISNSVSGARDGWREYSASSVEYLQSRLSAGDTIRLIAGNEILIDGAELISASGHIELLAEMGITVQDQTNATQYARKGKFGKTSIEESAYKTVAMRALLDAGKGIIIHSELGDITLKAADIRSQDGTHVTAQNGQVNLLVTTENDHYSYSSVKKSLFTTTTINRGRAIEDVVHTSVVGGLKVDALKGLNVEYRGQFDEQGNALDLDTQIEALGQMPGLEWMADARAQYPDADWQAIEAKYKEWNERNRSLSPAFAAVVAIAVAIVAGPAGAHFASTIGAGAATGAAATLSGVVVAAGATSFMSQAALAFANGAVNGDIGGAMEDFASDDTLKSLGIAMVTAGVMHSINADIFDIGVEGSGVEVVADLQFTDQVLHALSNATVNAGARFLIEGGNSESLRDSFVQSLASTGINRLGSYMAQKIGNAFDPKDPSAMQTALRYISHAGAGCVIGIASANVNDDEPRNEGACAAGAGGAVIGELVASVAREDQEILDTQDKIKNFMAHNSELFNEGQSYEEIKDILNNNASSALYLTELENMQRNGVDLARLAAAIGAFAAGASASEVNIAADLGNNAAANNARFLVATTPALLQAIDSVLKDKALNEIQTAIAGQILTSGSAANGDFEPAHYNLLVRDAPLQTADKVISGIVLFDKELIAQSYSVDALRHISVNTDVAMDFVHEITVGDFNYRMVPQGQLVDGVYEISHWLAQNTDTRQIEYLVGHEQRSRFQEAAASFGNVRGFYDSNPDRYRPAMRLAYEMEHGDTSSIIAAGFDLILSELGYAWTDPLNWLNFVPAAGTATKLVSSAAARRAIVRRSSSYVPNKFPLSQAKIDDIRAIPHGQRPDPSEYLPASYIDNHLSQFDDGAARFMTQRNLDKYGVGQRDGTSFVMTKQEADRLIKSTNGNPRTMEDALGLPEGFLEGNQLVRVDIPKPRELNLRIPSGNEAGANDLWIPGGKLPDGNLEAVIDVGNIPSSRFWYTPLQF